MSGRDIERVARAIHSELYSNPARSSDSVTVISQLPDAPISESATIPTGWIVTGSQMRDADGVVVHAPIVITERGRDDRRQQETLTLAWRVGGQWQTAVVDRCDIADSAKIVKLAGIGFPVTSVNARAIVSYLAEYEAANRDHLPQTRVSGRLGWQGVMDGFLWGHDYITDRESDHPFANVTFRGADAGDEQIASGYYTSGTMDGWSAAIAPIAKHPVPRFGYMPVLQQQSHRSSVHRISFSVLLGRHPRGNRRHCV